jgi:hypothetical protein
MMPTRTLSRHRQGVGIGSYLDYNALYTACVCFGFVVFLARHPVQWSHDITPVDQYVHCMQSSSRYLSFLSSK